MEIDAATMESVTRGRQLEGEEAVAALIEAGIPEDIARSLLTSPQARVYEKRPHADG